MTGQKYPSEKKIRTDQKTGHEFIQLTSGDANNTHLYFTENSFCKGRREIIFFSDRGSETRRMNLFSMDLDTGEMTRLSDFSGHISHGIKSPGGEKLFCFHDNQIVMIRREDLSPQVLYECPAGWKLSSMSLSCSGERIGFILNERVDVPKGANYKGFTEGMYAVKRSKIMALNIESRDLVEIFQDTHQLGHFQFSPQDETIAIYCHEGPWNLVHQRIWLLDLVARTVHPCFRQEADDSVGHEFWTRDNMVFFDNRRAGCDGTITSGKTQVYKPPEDIKQTPYIGFADKRGNLIRRADLPFYCNHYHANNDNSLLVGDDVEDLVLINIAKGPARLKTLCFHGTSWNGQSAHCHPCFDWEGRFILWLSDFGGKRNLYLIDSAQVIWT
ncbi:oligogalacturonate lyase [Spirochaetia bacterium]|nr:oligogalacturonate lyase [Spirochaetia bacterium]